MPDMQTRRIVSLAFLTALSVVLHYVESFIPYPIPGFRIGLANIIGLFTLFYYGGPSYVFVTLARVLLGGLFSGFGVSFLMSLAGSALAMGISLLCYYVFRNSVWGTSLPASALHTIGQLLVYALFFDTPYIFTYLALLGPLSLLTGALSALLSTLLIARLPDRFRSEEKARRAR